MASAYNSQNTQIIGCHGRKEVKLTAQAAPAAHRRTVSRDLGRRTIRDFGRQWQAFQSNDGYYASQDLLADILGPLLSPESLRGARVADVGSGTGRIVRMLLEAGAAHVTAVEPSEAFEVLTRNLADEAERVEFLNTTGEGLPTDRDFDFVFSIGVLHHIPDPSPCVRAALAALKPGGQLLIWVYGAEGNRAYFTLAKPLRAVTTRLPHGALLALSTMLQPLLWLYILACKVLPLPLRRYMLGVLGKLSAKDRVLVIYDQLNPAHAKYYRKDEVRRLLEDAGFVNVRLHHRHGYSWTALADKPAST